MSSCSEEGGGTQTVTVMSTGGRERWLWFSVFLLYLQVMSLFVVGDSGGVVWEHSRSSSMCHISTEKSMQSVLEENPFLRNCTEEEKHPLFLPTPSDIEALGHVLHNRTVAFIGDSTIQSQVHHCPGSGCEVACISMNGCFYQYHVCCFCLYTVRVFVSKAERQKHTQEMETS